MLHMTKAGMEAWLFRSRRLAEQRRIAEVLDRAEALRAKRRAALAQLDTLTQSIFLDLFGDPATNPKGWPLSDFGEIFGYLSAMRKRRLYNEPYRIRHQALSDRRIIDERRSRLPRCHQVRGPEEDMSDNVMQLRPGDVLISCYRQRHRASVALIETGRVIVIRANRRTLRATKNARLSAEFLRACSYNADA